MCGRFTLAHDPAKIAKRFKAAFIAVEELAPSYNIPPTAKVPIVLTLDGSRRLEKAQWGLKREWTPQIINLRVDKLLKGPFKNQLTEKRCIVTADGFYEWGTSDGKKYPVYFRLAEGELFGFAALYDEGNPKTFTLFTTTPNAVVAPVHDRMPVILDPALEDRWLNPEETDRDSLAEMLVPYKGPMTSWPVSPVVNSPRANDPELIKPLKSASS